MKFSFIQNMAINLLKDMFSICTELVFVTMNQEERLGLPRSCES